jgi:hypothetical protein
MRLKYNDIKNFLNEPTFEVVNPIQNIIVAILVGSFVSLFLLVFFNEEFHSAYSWIHFGLITSFTIIFVYYFYPLVLPKIFTYDNLKVKQSIFYNFVLVSNIAIFNLLYTYFYLDVKSLDYLFYLFFITFAIGIFPSVFIYMVFKIIHLKRNLEQSEKINSAVRNKQNLKQSNKEIIHIDNLPIEPVNFLFAKSEGNYLKINFISNNNIKTELIRFTLKEFLNTTKNINFIRRCHRSYVINADRILNVTGNSRGYQIYLENYNESIPMSNSFSEDILKVIEHR